MREHVVRRYEEWGLDGDVLAVVSALTVGDKSDLTPELKATYSASGASHVLALSGLHIGILAGILTLLLYPLRLFPLGRSLTGVLTVLLLWAFAFLSGLSASVVRAVTCSLSMWELPFSGRTFLRIPVFVACRFSDAVIPSVLFV